MEYPAVNSLKERFTRGLKIWDLMAVPTLAMWTLIGVRTFFQAFLSPCGCVLVDVNSIGEGPWEAILITPLSIIAMWRLFVWVNRI